MKKLIALMLFAAPCFADTSDMKYLEAKQDVDAVHLKGMKVADSWTTHQYLNWSLEQTKKNVESAIEALKPDKQTFQSAPAMPLMQFIVTISAETQSILRREYQTYRARNDNDPRDLIYGPTWAQYDLDVRRTIRSSISR